MKGKTIRLILVISIAIVAVVLNSCNKEARQKKEIIGTWVSTDYIDTLNFINDEIFEKNFPYSMERYFYEIKRDSIKINYSGSNFVLTIPTTHYLEIVDNRMSIDFSNRTYGIRQQEILFNRIY